MPQSARTDDRVAGKATAGRARPTRQQAAWLARGLDQPGGKLPLFDPQGRKVNRRIVEACLERGWAEPWFHNPIKPDWIVCKLTPRGREIAGAAGSDKKDNGTTAPDADG